MRSALACATSARARPDRRGRARARYAEWRRTSAALSRQVLGDAVEDGAVAELEEHPAPGAATAPIEARHLAAGAPFPGARAGGAGTAEARGQLALHPLHQADGAGVAEREQRDAPFQDVGAEVERRAVRR